MTGYSDEVLEAAPERVTKLLCAMGAVPVIRTVMENEGGMTNADIVEGRTLLTNVLVAPLPEPAPTDTPDAQIRRQAQADLDAWDEPNFAIVKATLQRRFARVAEYVFRDLSASKGADSVRGVATFLTRLRTLEEGTDPTREATREQDREAVAFLANRKITSEKRRELEAMVELALSSGPSIVESGGLVDPAVRRQALVELKMWFDEWSTIARKVVTKRSHLIRLGLAARRSPRGVEEPAEEPETGV
jgi:hypothetical protein